MSTITCLISCFAFAILPNHVAKTLHMRTRRGGTAFTGALGLTCALLSGQACADGFGAMVVWNHAYQETFEADSIASIRSQARDAYILIDPFKQDVGGKPAALVEALQARGNQVAAYISIGTGEDWRSDFNALRPHLVERPWGEWPGEYFVSTPNEDVLRVMQTRIDRIAEWGFDWVEFDNMDWAFDDAYRAQYGIEASSDDAVDYYRALCAYAQNAGVKCMAKSTVAGAERFDGVTYESYPDETNWWDTDGAVQFLDSGRPVIIVHYNEPDCAAVYADYRALYGRSLSFICEDPAIEGYVRFDTD